MAIYLQAIVQKKPVSYNAHLTLNGMSLMKPMVSNNALEAPLLSVEEKAHYYLVQGQTELAKKKLQEALRCFQIATELTPENPRIFFEQGLSLFDFGMQPGEEKVLLLANKQFKLATALDPDYFEAWQLWGMSLAFLGRVYNESHYFLEAEKKLIQALALAQEKDKDHLFDLYFEYGMVKSFLAKRTEEPIDWQASIQAFETASQYKGMATPLFWDAFGSSYLALTLLLGDMKWCVKAIHCFKQAIVLDTLYSEAWEHLSHALLYLYESTQDEDHFFQITECFTARAQHFPLEIDLWLSWAEFLLQSARATQDTRRLHMSIEKSRRVLSLCETSPKALACWGEALSFLGELSDQIDLIHEGQNKVLEALDQSGEDPLLWKAYGETYVSMGKYFEEPDYMYIAIEKFQQGLSIDRTQDTLWFAIGATYTEAGILLADPETLEKSLYFLSKAIDLRPRQGNYYFAQAVCLSLLGEYTHEEQPLESSIAQFEKALHFQKSAIYLHPEWLFQYAKALDLYAEFFDEESYYHRAIEIFSHVLMVDPDFPEVHYHLGLTHSHLGELTDNSDAFYKAVHFFKLALKHEEESDQILVDLGVTLINVAEHTFDPQEASSCFLEAESKLLQAAKTGNLQAYYQLACLASLLGDVERSLSFLYKAETFQALPAIEEMISDDWLEHTRSSASFATFLHYIERKNSIQEEL